jgi:transposase
MGETLFDLPPMEDADESLNAPESMPTPRLQRPDRRQLLLRPTDLESLLPENHRARVVWEFVSGLDLSRYHRKIRSVEGKAGRPSIDPAILLSLWLYATVEGVGSARAIDRLCGEHDAYRWICGGVSVNYHTLADFRVNHTEVLDQLLTQSVGVLLSEGLVTLQRVAQDGVRVRTGAGATSFRRKKTLKRCLKEARAQVRRLKKELDEDPAAMSRREAAAKQRAARERQERVAAALRQWDDVAKKKKAADREEKARVSTTDPDARVMKMADGGYRPAVNGQFATDVDSQAIVGVDATNLGSDKRAMPPMVDQIESRCGEPPGEYLVDGGFAGRASIESVSDRTTVYAPLKKGKDETRDPSKPMRGDTEAVAEWRERMETEEAKEIYRERAATAECVNAIARNRGLQQIPVRGLGKAKSVLLLFALAHNMMRIATLMGGVAAAS